MMGEKTIPIIPKIIPPINSPFQAMIKSAVNTNEGSICIKKSRICLPMGKAGLNASRANRLIIRLPICRLLLESSAEVLTSQSWFLISLKLKMIEI